MLFEAAVSFTGLQENGVSCHTALKFEVEKPASGGGSSNEVRFN